MAEELVAKVKTEPSAEAKSSEEILKELFTSFETKDGPEEGAISSDSSDSPKKSKKSKKEKKKKK